jgi:diguanylate cyclase (GGDEF)-like protein
MKRLLAVIAIIFGGASAAWAAAPATLTTLRAFRAITNAEARRALPVAFEATVTYYRDYDLSLFVEDDGAATWVQATPDLRVVLGDRVLVRGTTHDGFRPEVIADSVTVLHPGAMPAPLPASFSQLILGQPDSMRVTVRGTVRSADIVMHGRVPSIYLALLMDGGYIDATVLSDDASKLKDLLDAEVEITGVDAGKFDSKRQLTGIVIAVPRLADVKILKSAGRGSELLPATPMDEILGSYDVRNLTRRVRVTGTITYYQPGQAVVLQNGVRSLWITTQSEQPLHVGNLADATGFPDVHNGSLTLTRGQITEEQARAPVTPVPVSWPQLLSGVNVFDLVAVEGQVLVAVRAATQDEYVLVSDGHLFSAIYRHPDEGSGLVLPPMKPIAAGSKVRVTGICVPSYGSDPFNGPVDFDILLRSFDDITVTAQPSMLNIRNLMFVVVLLLVVVAIAGGNGWFLERKLRRQTALLSAHTEAEAELERKRSRILEDINGTRPLAEILEETMEMISLRLHGVPCWCEITDGARLGNCPPDVDRLLIVHQEIQARSGPAIGRVFAAFNPETPPANESQALSAGAKLATLAVESRRLYSDLHHRSEFDQLTDIHNRFSLEAHLDAQIEEARQNAGIFGLIYIDLDEFKLVNDSCGHHVGDLYLQEVARRMKQQLRSRDLLARLGGDEFAVLLPTVRSRAGVEEIAQRLEHCFDAPLILEGHTLKGSASLGIALYPEDSASRDGLLSAADTAMYAVKNRRRKIERELDQKTHPELSTAKPA